MKPMLLSVYQMGLLQQSVLLRSTAVSQEVLAHFTVGRMT